MEMQTKELRKAAEFGTPLYVFHEEELRETTRRLENTLGKAAGLCYAMKANPFLVKVMEQLVDRICNLRGAGHCTGEDISVRCPQKTREAECGSGQVWKYMSVHSRIPAAV